MLTCPDGRKYSIMTDEALKTGNEITKKIEHWQKHLKEIKDLSSMYGGCGGTLYYAEENNTIRVQLHSDFLPIRRDGFMKLYVQSVSDEIDNLNKQLAAL